MENGVADALSRFAYPASQTFLDVSLHGSAEDDREMRELLAVERVEEQGAGFVPVPSPAPVGLQLLVRTFKTRSKVRKQPGHTAGPAPQLESLGVGVAQEPGAVVQSVAFHLPPELLGPTGGTFVGQQGDIPEGNNVTLRRTETTGR